MGSFFIDRKYRLPRKWSNKELRKIAPLIKGEVVNVSAWKDSDKEGGFYCDYFRNASHYSITNYKAEARGFQGKEGEIFLDLEQVLSGELVQRFDVAFNHTTLEHTFDVFTAFSNLCSLSKDMVIVVVPHLQQMHSTFGDFWRFTPESVEKLFLMNGLKLVYLSFNEHCDSSVYIFAVGSRFPERWRKTIGNDCSYMSKYQPHDGMEAFIGCQAVTNLGYRAGLVLKSFQSILTRLYKKLGTLMGKSFI
ncbi:hypothetical protein [Pseudodesulfovibrio piezophilus]|uniref:Methyltransferase type 11 n=1 Tax=Pseudodesulfovibrio piezophilus (strain DSM 21447 / JCM 15486 / C1TLV30) TaxID=1322246 RepID=M1WMR5_PSEP2|nr:hypothetical protein [Pseudodesulfovibrio piezophilus]CCH49910.1 protein of unknown function [Pseudodesulfovibrio piezophilus C1TLV30]